MQLRRIFLWSMIVSLALAAALGIAAILLPRFGRTQECILLTALVVGLFSLPALGIAIVIGRRQLLAWMWTGLVCTLAATVLWLVMVWTDTGFSLRGWEEIVLKSAACSTVASIVIAQAGLLMLLRFVHEGFSMVRLATIACSVILGSLIALAIWFELDEPEIQKMIAVLAILAVCGTIVTPVLGIIQLLQRRASRESIPSSVKIDLTCPRCGERQLIPAGPAHCAYCRLRINIDVEEPRCVCGYLLYQLQGDTCPECGRVVRSANVQADAAAMAPPPASPTSGK